MSDTIVGLELVLEIQRKNGKFRTLKEDDLNDIDDLDKFRCIIERLPDIVCTQSDYYTNILEANYYYGKSLSENVDEAIAMLSKSKEWEIPSEISFTYEEHLLRLVPMDVDPCYTIITTLDDWERGH